jgi:hypothetical protein
LGEDEKIEEENGEGVEGAHGLLGSGGGGANASA